MIFDRIADLTFSLNIPLITFSLLLNITKYYKSPLRLLLFLIVVGILISYFSFKGYNQTVASFYDKARILELDKKNNPQSNSN